MRVVQRSGRPSASGDTDRRFPSRVKRAAKRRLARQQRLVKEHQLQEKVAARASAGGPVTRAAAEDIRAAEGHPQKEQRFQPLALPTHEAVIWHRNYLISMGLLQNHDDRRVKADKIALDLCSVWEGQEIHHRPLRRVKRRF